jgi:hypothetical protein
MSRKRKDKPELKSDRAWGGKNILTGEEVQKDRGTMPPGWKHAESYEDAEGYVNCFCDGKRIARYPTEETERRLRKETQ